MTNEIKIVNEDNDKDYSILEVAEIIGVTDEIVRRWCERGKYPEAKKTETGNWRIPEKYFKITIETVRKRKQFEKELDDYNMKSQDN